jgi:hypothetical protein
VAGLEVTSTSLRIRPLSAVNDGLRSQDDTSAPIVLARFDVRPRLYKTRGDAPRVSASAASHYSVQTFRVA